MNRLLQISKGRDKTEQHYERLKSYGAREGLSKLPNLQLLTKTTKQLLTYYNFRAGEGFARLRPLSIVFCFRKLPQTGRLKSKNFHAPDLRCILAAERVI